MKIDKKNPKHWLTLFITGINTVIAIIYRVVSRKRDKKIIIFYGHKFNGNLKSFYEFLTKNHMDYKVYYLTMDSEYGKSLPDKVQVLLATSIRDMMKVARSSVMMTSHGSHALVFLNKFTDIKFIDVWHGVSFKGWGKDSFGEQKMYEQVWVSSPTMRDIYINKYGFKPEIVKVTGYSRIDQLVNGEINREEVIEKYEIPAAKKYVLIAVTWKQDDAGRSIIPFGLDENEFFMALEELGRKNDTLIIFRTHLNSSGAEMDTEKNLQHVHFMPYHKYEVAEEFLALADILVTDWSSIAFDFLPLKRPTIFLDVESPFREGFALGPEYRFGPVVGNLQKLTDAVGRYITDQKAYEKAYEKHIGDAVEVAYGNTMDGKSSERYFDQLKDLTG